MKSFIGVGTAALLLPGAIARTFTVYKYFINVFLSLNPRPSRYATLAPSRYGKLTSHSTFFSAEMVTLNQARSNASFHDIISQYVAGLTSLQMFTDLNVAQNVPAFATG